MRRKWRTTARGRPRGWYRVLMRRRWARESRRLESLLRAYEQPADPERVRAAFAGYRGVDD